MLGPAGRQNGRESHTGGDCSGVDGMERGLGAACSRWLGKDETSVGGSLRTARMGWVASVSESGGLGRATAQGGGSGNHDRRQANAKASWNAGQGRQGKDRHRHRHRHHTGRQG
jgi:hypothetical protein